MIDWRAYILINSWTTVMNMLLSKVYWSHCNTFFQKSFQSILRGHWYPCSGLLVISALGFKARVCPSLACFVTCMLCHLHAMDSLADLLAASIASQPFFDQCISCVHMYWWDSNPGTSMPLHSVWQPHNRISHASWAASVIPFASRLKNKSK